jgi:hypothetical protein
MLIATPTGSTLEDLTGYPDCRGSCTFYSDYRDMLNDAEYIETPASTSSSSGGCVSDATWVDSGDDPCSWYLGSESSCGTYDTSSYGANDACCECGGGTYGAPAEYYKTESDGFAHCKNTLGFGELNLKSLKLYACTDQFIEDTDSSLCSNDYLVTTYTSYEAAAEIDEESDGLHDLYYKV